MKNLPVIAFCAVGAAVFVGVGLYARHRPARKPWVKPVYGPIASVAERRKENEAVVDRYKNDPAPESQDKVGEAEMRLAYFDAQKNDFESSRKLFLQAEKVKGTGAMGADFGGINNQAAYQAAVCLVAEHKDAEARAAFRKFLVDFQLSPLTFAAEKRLVRMNHGKSDPADEALLQAAIRAQEARGRFETTVCGPKTVAYLMKQYPKLFGAQPAKEYKELASIVGTGSAGTSIEGMCKGLKKLGCPSFALELNRKDLQNLTLPAILLDGDHYFAIVHRDGSKLNLFDTLQNSKREITLPGLDATDFRATVIAFSLEGLDTDNLTAGPPPVQASPSPKPNSTASSPTH